MDTIDAYCMRLKALSVAPLVVSCVCGGSEERGGVGVGVWGGEVVSEGVGVTVTPVPRREASGIS